jgi:hypothetical protein
VEREFTSMSINNKLPVDLKFYDYRFGPEAYLHTNADDTSRWPPEESEG